MRRPLTRQSLTQFVLFVWPKTGNLGFNFGNAHKAIVPAKKRAAGISLRPPLFRTRTRLKAAHAAHAGHSAAHAAAARRHRRSLLRTLRHQRLGGEDEARNGRRVLQGGARDLRGVNNALRHKVAELAGGRIVALPAVFNLLHNHGAFHARVVGNLPGGFFQAHGE